MEDAAESESLRDGKTAKIVLSRQGELKEIMEGNPQLAARVDGFEEQLRDRMRRLRASIDAFPEAERLLVSFLVRHGIDRMADEVFLPQS